MNIAEKKEEILAVCRTAKKVYRGDWAQSEEVGCGCPMTLFAESLGWKRNDSYPMFFLMSRFEGVRSFIEGFDGGMGVLNEAYKAGMEVHETLFFREGINFHMKGTL